MKVIKVELENGVAELRASEDGKFFCIADLARNVKGGGAYYSISKILSEQFDSEIRKNIDGNLYVDIDKFINMIEKYKESYPRTTKDYSATLRKALANIMQNITSVESKKLNALEHSEEAMAHLREAVNILKKFDNFDGLAELQGNVARLEFENKEQGKLLIAKELEIKKLKEQADEWNLVRNLFIRELNENKKGNKRHH